MLEVHVNFAGAGEAAAISREAVEKRLAAAANIHGPVRSFYWWKETVESAEETAVVFKTSDERVDALIAFIADKHSYEVPGITVHRPLTASRPYLDWIDNETRRRA